MVVMQCSELLKHFILFPSVASRVKRHVHDIRDPQHDNARNERAQSAYCNQSSVSTNEAPCTVQEPRSQFIKSGPRIIEG